MNLPSRRTAASEAGWPPLRRLVVVLLTLNVMSALLFVVLVDRPVFDDDSNIQDVSRYARQGVSWATIRAHINPSGPTSLMWMAAGVRWFGGRELSSARLANLVSWVLLGLTVLVWARYSREPASWYAALLVTLIFPHTLTATATVMTEGPALLFAMLGTLVWVEFICRPVAGRRRLALLAVGALCMGIAVTCRQYYLALLPGAVLAPLCCSRSQAPGQWALGVTASFWFACVAALPVGVLWLAWGGLSSPGMVSGASYGAWHSTVGVSPGRPLVAAFYVAVYLVPLTLPCLWRLEAVRRRGALAIAILSGVSAVLFRSQLLQPGPIHSLAVMAGRFSGGEAAAIGVTGFVAAYNAVAVSTLLRKQGRRFVECPPAFFASCVIGFFVLEQIGVGGDIPFYDRYVLQIAPFLGVLAFAVLPDVSGVRASALLLLSALSHALLWRHAFAS